MTETEQGQKRWLCLMVLVFLPFMSTLDANITNVALPVIAKDLQITMADVEWVTTIYLIVISSTIIIFGRLGDMKGKAKIFNIGFVLFTLGSLLCGLSRSFDFLIFARVLQSLGAACAMSTNQGIITQIFPQGERGRALGIAGMAVALGTMTGAPLGGLIISVASWQYIFLVNVPIGIIACVLALVILPKEQAKKGEKLDVRGAVLYFTSTALFLLTLNAGQRLHNKGLVALGCGLAVILLCLFVYMERKTEKPLLDVGIFSNKLFSLSIFCAFLAFMAISSINIIHPFYLQDIILLSAGATGIFMMISPLVTFVTAPISGYVSDKIGSEGLTFIGLCIEAIGLFCLSLLKDISPLVQIGCFIGLAAFGSALFHSPNTSLIMSTVPKDKLGVAGSINALVRNVGMTIGILTATSVLYHSMSMQLGQKVLGYVPGEQAAFIDGMHDAYLTAALVCMTGAVLTGIRLIRKKQA